MISPFISSQPESNPPMIPPFIPPFIHLQPESMENDEHKSNTHPKPPNAFLLFSRAMRSQVQNANRSLSSREVSIELGKLWKELGEEEKIRYKEEAKRLFKEFKDQHPNYSYHKHPKEMYSGPIITQQPQFNITIMQANKNPINVKVNYFDTPQLILNNNPTKFPSKGSYSISLFFHHDLNDKLLSLNQPLTSQGIKNNDSLIAIFLRINHKKTNRRETTLQEQLILIPKIIEYFKANTEEKKILCQRIFQQLSQFSNKPMEPKKVNSWYSNHMNPVSNYRSASLIMSPNEYQTDNWVFPEENLAEQQNQNNSAMSAHEYQTDNWVFPKENLAFSIGHFNEGNNDDIFYDFI